MFLGEFITAFAEIAGEEVRGCDEHVIDVVHKADPVDFRQEVNLMLQASAVCTVLFGTTHQGVQATLDECQEAVITCNSNLRICWMEQSASPVRAISPVKEDAYNIERA